jgi:hypothetical protein
MLDTTASGTLTAAVAVGTSARTNRPAAPDGAEISRRLRSAGSAPVIAGAPASPDPGGAHALHIADNGDAGVRRPSSYLCALPLTR